MPNQHLPEMKTLRAFSVQNAVYVCALLQCCRQFLQIVSLTSFNKVFPFDAVPCHPALLDTLDFEFKFDLPSETHTHTSHTHISERFPASWLLRHLTFMRQSLSHCEMNFH